MATMVDIKTGFSHLSEPPPVLSGLPEFRFCRTSGFTGFPVLPELGRGYRAWVVELVDTQDSGSCVRKDVGVRLSSQA